MKQYGDRGGRSGVVAYRSHDDAIDVLFSDDIVYTYDYATTGRQQVERMKWLARGGKGLASYINRHTEVREGYAAKCALAEYEASGRDKD